MDPTIAFIDVEYLDTAGLIACGILETEAGLLLVDPGPATALETLGKKLTARGTPFDDVHALLLTHIHLDHAGATGLIVDRYPHIQVYVHRIGALHLIRPEKLLSSVKRLYGDDMDRLWGTFLAVPDENVHPLEGGENLDFGGHPIEVAYTPGHAIHHVSYLDRETGTAFVGDVAGMRIPGVDSIVPITPPPDIDLERWHESFEVLRAWQPERLFLTHFGPSKDVTGHLEEMRCVLGAWSEQVRDSLDDDREDSERADAFHDAQITRFRLAMSEQVLPPYEKFGRPENSWYGLARYWRKRNRKEPHQPPREA
ncbi:MAG: MBL fold metallo-hydrolase [Rhodothermales bacterium]